MPRIDAGTHIPARVLTTITSERAPIPDPTHVVHLQFRRYAGCPYCNLHLRSIVARYEEIMAAGVREVVVFHSTTQDLLKYNSDIPLAVVPDPDKHLYREFGVERSPRALLDPRAWYPAIIGAIRKHRPLSADHRSGHLGLPADFLIANDGRVLANKYGVHAFDQWSVDELLQQVRTQAGAT